MDVRVAEIAYYAGLSGLRIVVGVRGLKASRVLAVIVLLDALIMAFGHAPLGLFLGPMIRPPPSGPPANATRTRGPAATGGSPVPFAAIGAYFLLATVLYILGGIFVVSGKLFKPANLGLIILAIVDNVLLIYTRAMPNIFFGRAIPWSWGGTRLARCRSSLDKPSSLYYARSSCTNQNLQILCLSSTQRF
jgi:hypothetical protein